MPRRAPPPTPLLVRQDAEVEVEEEESRLFEEVVDLRKMEGAPWWEENWYWGDGGDGWHVSDADGERVSRETRFQAKMNWFFARHSVLLLQTVDK